MEYLAKARGGGRQTMVARRPLQNHAEGENPPLSIRFTAVYGHDQGTLIDKSNELLEAIRVKRDDDDETKPLILLGHNLGSLLIKGLLVNAHNNPKYTHLKLAT